MTNNKKCTAPAATDTAQTQLLNNLIIQERKDIVNGQISKRMR